MAAAEREALVAGLVEDWAAVELSSADHAMLQYAVSLTREPAAITREDVDRLRHTGFDDRAIHDICAITAYYAFVNRIADGLGVELERALDRDAPR